VSLAPHSRQRTLLRVVDAVEPGAILVTDAISPMGLLPGTYVAGNRRMVVSDRGETYLEGTRTLAGRCVHRRDVCGRGTARLTRSAVCVGRDPRRTASRRWTSAYATFATLRVRPNRSARLPIAGRGAQSMSVGQPLRYMRPRPTECSIVEALQAATLHPAQLLGITHRKGTLNVGADADLVVLDDDLNVRATFVRGELAYKV